MKINLQNLSMTREELIDQVLKAMMNDIAGGDLTAIEELLAPLSDEQLIAYLPEV